MVVAMLAMSLAQAAELPAQLERDANADGSLIAMAAFCKHPIEERKKLLTRMTEEALAQAQKDGVALTEAQYRDLAAVGYQSTAGFLSKLPMQGESYERNCKDVLEKIEKRMK